MTVADRFHDPGDPLEVFFDEVLVRCPRCDELARVVLAPPLPGSPERIAAFADRRLVCGACGLARTWPAAGAKRRIATGTDADPWFGERLWLRHDVAGHVLWAYNVRHLDLLAGFIGAKQRSRDLAPGTIHSVVNHLPTWMKQAGRRDELLAAIAAMRSTLPA